MTAEIAILNKSAVALAADSAVTISAGSSQEKIYDSADKLFELSCTDPIGVMVNGGMNFMQVPLSVIIKRYRASCPSFLRVTDAADKFLTHLADFGKLSSDNVKGQELINTLAPIFRIIKDRVENGFYDRLFGPDGVKPEYAGEDGFTRARQDVYKFQIAVMKEYLTRSPDADFIGVGELVLSEADNTLIAGIIDGILDEAAHGQRDEAFAVAVLALKKANNFQPTTGLVVAGFGSDDLFPTLVSFEIYGVFGGQLKVTREHAVDVDRDGDRARVIPFAQREMVERFLYGLDGGIQRNITQFCKEAVPRIRERVLGHLDMSEADHASLTAVAIQAEEAFYDSLDNDSFDAIRKDSQTEIEDMVEFMPKPEMARMAEALVNLTSIKRRVTRGMETVGGPIDVAVISQAEGFVWVKRKHYFPQELNSRYFDRKRATSQSTGENR